MKYLDNNDVNFLGKRAGTTLGETKRVMQMIDRRAGLEGLVVGDTMTLIQVNSLYNVGERAILEALRNPEKKETGSIARRLINKQFFTSRRLFVA